MALFPGTVNWSVDGIAGWLFVWVDGQEQGNIPVSSCHLHNAFQVGGIGRYMAGQVVEWLLG